MLACSEMSVHDITYIEKVNHNILLEKLGRAFWDGTQMQCWASYLENVKLS